MREKFYRIESWVGFTIKWSAVVFFILGAIGYGYELFLRFFFEKSLYWLSSWVPYFFVIASLYGASYAVRSNENIKVEILKKLSTHAGIKKAVNLLALLVSLLILWVFYQNFSFSLEKETWIFVKDLPYIHLFLATIIFYGVNIFLPDRNR